MGVDNDIFHEILQPRKDDRETGERSTPPTNSIDGESGADVLEHDPEVLVSSENGLLVTETSQSGFSCIESMEAIFPSGISYFNAPIDNRAWQPELPVTEESSARPVFDIDSTFTMFDAYPPLISFLNTGQVSPITAINDTASYRAVPCQFINKIEKACLNCIATTLGLPETAVFAKGPTAPEVEDRGAQCISYVAAVAVYLLTFFSGLDTYIYGIGSNVPFERIMRWRISPTVKNRQAIPEPFRPTPLQFNSLEHPMAIDFIPSPSIRDQLILKANDCDLDQVIQDILLHTVVELPQYRVALATLDVYVQSMLPKDKSHESESRAILAPSWSFSQYNANQVDEILVHEVSWRMKNGTTACLTSGEGGLPIPKFRKNSLASKYGIDRVEQWKLSKEFCESHPYLDCSSGELRSSVLLSPELTMKAVTSYPVVPWTSIPAF
jgi:hypothetical protein